MNKLVLLFIQSLSYLWYFLWYLILLPYLLILVSLGLDWFSLALININPGERFLSSDWMVVKNLVVIALFLIGASLVLAAWKVLVDQAQAFPFTIIYHKKFNPQKVVRSGVYQLVRHPMLLGYFFLLEALAVFLFSPSFILWTAPLCVWVLLELALLTEEKKLVRWFGEEYARYQRETPALIPHRAGLKALLRDRNPL